MRDPGPAARRSATSAWTMTTTPWMEGKASSMLSRTGTATLYGRFATSLVGAGQSTPKSSTPLISVASMVTTWKRSAASLMRARTVSGSAAARGGSISTARTRAPTSRSARVREPRPGPTSTTSSPSSTPPAATILRTVPASCTKFWPSTFVGRIPSASEMALTSRGPSRPVSEGTAPSGRVGSRRRESRWFRGLEDRLTLASLVHGVDEARASGAVRLGASRGGRRRQDDAHLVLPRLFTENSAPGQGSTPGPAHRRLRQHLTFLNNVARNLIWSDSSNATKPHDSNDAISNLEIHAGELRATLETRPRNRQRARHGHTSG